MNPAVTRCFLALALAGALLTPRPAQAGGTKSKGLAGSGMALPEDATAARLNPAGMVWVGKRADIGMAFFNGQRSYTLTGEPSTGNPAPFNPESVDSEKPFAMVPNTGVNWMLNDRSSFGISLWGTGTMNTTYPGSAQGGAGTFLGGPAGVSTEMIYMLATYSRKMSDTASWGVSAVVVAHRFRATGLSNMAAYVSDGVADNLSNRGYDFSLGMGAKVGVQAQVLPRLTMGASYQSKVLMSKLRKYSDLFAEQGKFDGAPVALVGLAWHTSPATALVFDVERTMFSAIPSVHNPSGNLAQGQATGDASYLLGGSNGAGFGWRDQTIYKLGYEWQSSPRWTWRGGVSYGRQPIPDSEVGMSILAPNTTEWRTTLGATRDLGKGREVNVTLMYAPQSKISGPNPFEAPGRQTVELSSRQFEIETAWAWKF